MMPLHHRKLNELATSLNELREGENFNKPLAQFLSRYKESDNNLPPPEDSRRAATMALLSDALTTTADDGQTKRGAVNAGELLGFIARDFGKNAGDTFDESLIALKNNPAFAQLRLDRPGDVVTMMNTFQGMENQHAAKQTSKYPGLFTVNVHLAETLQSLTASGQLAPLDAPAVCACLTEAAKSGHLERIDAAAAKALAGEIGKGVDRLKGHMSETGGLIKDKNLVNLDAKQDLIATVGMLESAEIMGACKADPAINQKVADFLGKLQAADFVMVNADAESGQAMTEAQKRIDSLLVLYKCTPALESNGASSSRPPATNTLEDYV
jgi:hypothetical protein